MSVMLQFRLPSDELEYAVLAELWRLRSASVRELHERPGAAGNLAYTTTAKVVDRLRAKGLIRRQREGNAFRYEPRIAREEVERARARSSVARLLGPAPQAAVAALVEAIDAVDPQLLEELERAVAARRRAKRGT
ncbi:MAG TPA: BlaI/MecI/CopY family transcriptional regulator [Steroidobacteraceae bacterium]|nr:BlaI/MecI/CopY family transcriptional regulator [Steroidobacteraceae bacterium]